jgi:hypothetical protein
MYHAGLCTLLGYASLSGGLTEEIASTASAAVYSPSPSASTASPAGGCASSGCGSASSVSPSSYFFRMQRRLPCSTVQYLYSLPAALKVSTFRVPRMPHLGHTTPAPGPTRTTCVIFLTHHTLST